MPEPKRRERSAYVDAAAVMHNGATVLNSRIVNILLLSWRLPSHPRSGGAEVLTQRIAEHLVEFGHTVCWAGGGLTAPASHAGGVRYVALGSQVKTLLNAPNFYRRLPHPPDIVIEQINTLPFFAAAYVHAPVLTWFNQLARAIWWYEAPFPFNAIGYVAEPWYLRFYREADVVTISKSSADDLRKHRIGKRISIIPMAADAPGLARLDDKPAGPIRLAFIGRIVASKRPSDAIRALALVRQHREAVLAVVGSGDPSAVQHARAVASREGVEDFVTFHGFIDAQERERILSDSHLLVVPSAKEGWGMVVTEANMAGTPAVAYNVDGLKDAISDGETGWLCEPTSAALAQAVLATMADRRSYERVRVQAWNTAKSLSWETTTRALERVLEQCIHDYPQRNARKDSRCELTNAPGGK